jgi:DNA repair exonuclease SbcCD ATPase subunit
MKLTHVSVEGCGRFGTPCRIEGLGPGVNILSASNEAGKSTLFRAIRTCLFERHSSTKEEIQALATEGLSLPVTITVAFEKDGRNYEIRKSFLRSKAASLSCDGVETARNAEADEEVLRLLGIEQRSARALDEAAFGILWVAQGRSFETPEPSEGARSALNAVIQQEVGTLVGGERARLLINSVNEELGRYVTKTGQAKANGPLDRAQKERARLTGEHMDAEASLATLHARLEDLDKLRRELKVANDPAAMQSWNEQLKQAKDRLEAAERAGEELKRLTSEERQAHQWAEAQQEKLDQLRAQASSIADQRLRLKEMTTRLAPLDEEEKAAALALQQASAEKIRLDSAADALDASAAEMQRLLALGEKLARRAEMEQRLELLRNFRRRMAENEAALKVAAVDDAAVKALETIELEEAKIRAAMEAGAARVAITVKAGAAVTLNGAALTANATHPVTEPLTIAVGEDVAITVSPPPAARGSTMALAREREKLTGLLARHGVTGAAELRARRRERAELEDVARDLRAEHAALVLKDDAAKEIERLETAIGAIAAEAQRTLPAGSAGLPAAADIEAQKQEIAVQQGDIRARRSSFEAQIKAHNDALTRLASACGSLRGQIEAIHAQLQSALALLPDEARDRMIADCEAELSRRRDAHRVRAAALAEKQVQAPAPEEAERQKGRMDRLTSAIAAQTEKVNGLREAIARLEGEVQIAGGEGLGERAAVLKLQQEMALAEEARLNERLEVLKLLRTTVDGCYARRREQLNAPLLRHLKPFLNDVFPDAGIELGENFTITALSRSGPQSEVFGRLSLGTQEQIAVLVRLAMGAMICEKGTDVPIILDDALVFSDDERIEQMFDAINRAGRNQQVIVLTCRARSFASLGGKQLQIV